MRNQKFDSFIQDKLSQNADIIIKNNLLQTQNLGTQKRSRCSSINESKRPPNELYQKYSASSEKDQDQHNKMLSTGFKTKIPLRNSDKEEFLNQSQQSEQLLKPKSAYTASKSDHKVKTDQQQYTLKLNGITIAEQHMKRRSKSHMNDSQNNVTGVSEPTNNSYYKELNYSQRNIQFQQQNIKLQDDNLKDRSFRKTDSQTEYLYRLKTKTPEKQQIKQFTSQMRNYSAEKTNHQQVPYVNLQNTPYLSNNSHHLQNMRHLRSYSSNNKHVTNPTVAATQNSFYPSDQKQYSQYSINQFNDQPLSDPKFITSQSKNAKEYSIFLQNSNMLQTTNYRKSIQNSRINSRASNLSTFESGKKDRNFKTNQSRGQTEQTEEDNSDDDEITNAKDEQQLLIKCQKKLNNSIRVLQKCISQAQNVQDILMQNKEKYEKEGNKEMIEFLKTFNVKENDQSQSQNGNTMNNHNGDNNNQNMTQQNIMQNQSKTNGINNTTNQNNNNSNQKQKQKKQMSLQLDDPQEERSLNDVLNEAAEDNEQNKMLQPTPKSEVENAQTILKKQINESIKKIEKYLDYSIQASKQSTIQMDQTQLLDPINIKPNEIYLKEESFVHKTINLLQYNKHIITTDLFYSNYQTLPFDFNEIENNSASLLGQGTFGKVYKAKLYDKSKRYKHQPVVVHHKKKKNKDLIELLREEQEENQQEDEFYALKVIRCKDMQELEKRAQEIVIEYYLMSKQFRHSCKLLLPAYYIQKNEYFELLFLKQLADFNFTQLLNKRREKYLAYTESELLAIYKQLLMQPSFSNHINYFILLQQPETIKHSFNLFQSLHYHSISSISSISFNFFNPQNLNFHNYITINNFNFYQYFMIK